MRWPPLVGIYAMAAFTTLPILVTLLVECCMHVKYKSLASLARPADGWGPYNRLKRYARNYFYPQRDVKYRNTTLKCKHNCVINSSIYYDEVRAHNIKLNRAIEEHEHTNNYEFSDLYRKTVRK
ncbi:hypothetical protein QE152_g4313 [Popillia japonica]|uniref:Uncharacterized protein n=1 Tax=Popillia japonica TaxID=7064 RepID=A0AAW1N0T2_POPJA